MAGRKTEAREASRSMHTWNPQEIPCRPRSSKQGYVCLRRTQFPWNPVQALRGTEEDRMIEHRMIATVDLGRFRDRGWQMVRSLGKDVLVSKPTSDLTDDERQWQQQRARGG